MSDLQRCPEGFCQSNEIARLRAREAALVDALAGLVAAIWAFQIREPGLEPEYRQPSPSELRVLTEMLEAAEALAAQSMG